jgi:transcriptional regulator with XRE-family HTH domain
MYFTNWAEPVGETVEERTFLNGLGRQIRVLRQQRNLTQAELAERAGIGPKYVGEIERGRTNPTMRLVWRLSKALGVEVFEIFLFSLSDGEQESKLRTQLVRLLKNRRGKELERMAQILKLFEE